MQRYDIFESIHKGLKALLYNTALLLQQTDFSNGETEDDLIERVKETIQLFEEHLETESKYILQVIFDFEPGVADQFLQNQRQFVLLCSKLKDALGTYQSDQVEKTIAGKCLAACYADFMIFQLQVMAREEDVLSKILWSYFSDKHIIQLQKEILQHDCKHSTKLTKWMLRGINDSEAIVWLKSVEETAPQEKFQALFIAAEKELPERRYKRILSSLSEGVMLA